MENLEHVMTSECLSMFVVRDLPHMIIITLHNLLNFQISQQWEMDVIND